MIYWWLQGTHNLALNIGFITEMQAVKRITQKKTKTKNSQTWNVFFWTEEGHKGLMQKLSSTDLKIE